MQHVNLSIVPHKTHSKSIDDCWKSNRSLFPYLDTPQTGLIAFWFERVIHPTWHQYDWEMWCALALCLDDTDIYLVKEGTKFQVEKDNFNGWMIMRITTIYKYDNAIFHFIFLFFKIILYIYGKCNVKHDVYKKMPLLIIFLKQQQQHKKKM